MLKISFLGPPNVAFNNIPFSELNRSPIMLRLFAFLVTHRYSPQQRSTLVGTFWPDLSESRAHRTLNNVMWRLRSAMHQTGNLLQSDAQTIQFNVETTHWLDISEFECLTYNVAHPATGQQDPLALKDNRLNQFEDALMLYRGDFLSGIDDEWCLPYREQWRERYFNLLEYFADECEGYGDFPRALHVSRQLATLDPYRQSVHQRLIELYIALNRLGDARNQFRQYERIWQEELRLPLSLEMIQLATQYSFPLTTTDAPARIFVTNTNQKDLQTHLETSHADNSEYLHRQLEIHRQRDELYDLMADRKEQGFNLLVAQALADKLNEPAVHIDILARRSWLATRQGEYVEALTLLQKGLHICDGNSEQLQVAMLHRLMGVVSEEMGDFKAALHHYNKALMLDEGHQALTSIPANLNNVAAVQITLGKYSQAIQHLERAHRLITPDHLFAFQVKVLGNLGTAWLKLGQMEKADNYLRQAMTLAQRTGEHDAQWWIAAKLSTFYYLSGNTEHALSFALHYFYLAQPTGDAWILTALADILAKLYLDIRDDVQGLSWAKWMYEHAIQKQQWRYLVHGLLRLTQAYLLGGEHEEALTAITEAVKEYDRKGQELEEEPELFYTYAKVAKALDLQQVASQAQKRAERALVKQLAGISDQALRQRFLQVQVAALSLD